MKRQNTAIRSFTSFVLIPLVILLNIFAFANSVFANSIEEIQWDKIEPCNELSINFETLKTTVVASKTTAHNPVVIWTYQPADEETQNLIIESLKGNPGVGNPKEFSFISGETASMLGMTVLMNEGKVVFDATSNWALIYCGTIINTPTGGEGEVTPPGEEEVTPPGEGEVTPPGEGEVTPPGEGEVTPPGEEEVTPPGEGEVVPPGEEEVVPPGEEEVTPPGEDEVVPPGEEEVTPPGEDEVVPPNEDDTVTNPDKEDTNSNVTVPSDQPNTGVNDGLGFYMVLLAICVLTLISLFTFNTTKSEKRH